MIADLFESLAQEQRSLAQKMKSDRACRNFRVDVRSTSYFSCQCGHPKSAHAFSPLPEEELFVGSSGITPKWDVEEEANSEVRESVLSFGDELLLEQTVQQIPCLDEFRKNVKEKQALQQPRITAAEKMSQEEDDEMTDREISSDRSGSERRRSSQQPSRPAPTHRGLHQGAQAALSVDSTTSPSSSITGVQPPDHVVNRAHQGVAQFLQQQRQNEMREQTLRAEIEQEWTMIMAKRAREVEAEMERRFDEAITKTEEEQQKLLDIVDANHRTEIELMRNQFMGQLDEIESNAQAHIAEVKKSYEQADKAKDNRTLILMEGLSKQAKAQMEELRVLRDFRDRQLAGSPSIPATNPSGWSGPGGGGGRVLATPTRRLSREHMVPMEQLREADEEDLDDATLSPRSPHDNNEQIRSPRSNVVRPPKKQSSYDSDEEAEKARSVRWIILVVCVLFASIAVLLASRFGVRSFSDFRRQVLRPVVLQISAWLIENFN